jgi:L-asparagine permease
MIVRPKVVANTGDRLKAVWSETGPTYGSEAIDLENEPIDPLLLPPIDPDLLEPRRRNEEDS